MELSESITYFSFPLPLGSNRDPQPSTSSAARARVLCRNIVHPLASTFRQKWWWVAADPVFDKSNSEEELDSFPQANASVNTTLDSVAKQAGSEERTWLQGVQMVTQRQCPEGWGIPRRPWGVGLFGHLVLGHRDLQVLLHRWSPWSYCEGAQLVIFVIITIMFFLFVFLLKKSNTEE